MQTLSQRESIERIVDEALGFYFSLPRDCKFSEYISKIYCGDLSIALLILVRYKKPFDGNTFDRIFYQSAVELCPDYGRAYAQIGILDAKSHSEDALLMFYKSVMVENPVQNDNNIKLLVKKHLFGDDRFLKYHGNCLLNECSPHGLKKVSRIDFEVSPKRLIILLACSYKCPREAETILLKTIVKIFKSVLEQFMDHSVKDTCVTFEILSLFCCWIICDPVKLQNYLHELKEFLDCKSFPSDELSDSLKESDMNFVYMKPFKDMRLSLFLSDSPTPKKLTKSAVMYRLQTLKQTLLQ